jgi:hypothetical protein
MMVFAVGIELANVVAVQCLHDTDPRQHRRPAASHEHQRFDRSLPLLGLMLGLRKFGDVAASVLESDELAAAWQRNWIFTPRSAFWINPFGIVTPYP